MLLLFKTFLGFYFWLAFHFFHFHLTFHKMDRCDGKFDIPRKPVANSQKPSAIVTSTAANSTTTIASSQVENRCLPTATNSSTSRKPENGDDDPPRDTSRDGLRPPDRDSLRHSTSTHSSQPFTVSAPTSGRTTPSDVTLFEEDSSTRSRSASTTGKSAWLTTPSMKIAENSGSQRDKSGQHGHVSQYFSRTFLVGMATIFVIMILALEILNMFSQRNQGIVAVDENNHYLWTYGPTFSSFTVRSWKNRG